MKQNVEDRNEGDSRICGGRALQSLGATEKAWSPLSFSFDLGTVRSSWLVDLSVCGEI